MMSPVLEWLKDRIRIREHECALDGIFYLHSEFRHNLEEEEMLYENEK